jgi:hypothetical protein
MNIERYRERRRRFTSGGYTHVMFGKSSGSDEARFCAGTPMQQSSTWCGKVIQTSLRTLFGKSNTRAMQSGSTVSKRQRGESSER